MRKWINRLRFLTPGKRRSLVTEILVLQLLFAAYIGVIAVSTLWWGANWAVTNNVSRWSREWVGNLGQLGAPLYASAEDQSFVVIEDYVAQFPEINYVRYYDEAAHIIFREVTGTASGMSIPDLDPAEIENLGKKFRAGQTEEVLNQSFADSRFRIVAPVVVDGLDTPVLREGTEEEAGMKPGTVEKVHAVLEKWVNNSDQPFNACVARRGVVFFNRAYGSRNGEPITPDTKHVVFSISKALSGSLLMTFVEQGIISLDDPVGTVCPEFQEASVETPEGCRLETTRYSGGYPGLARSCPCSCL